MKKETLQAANKIQQQIVMLNNIKMRLENEQGHFNVTFGVCIHESFSSFMPITNEDELTKELTTASLNHCNKKLVELQEQLDKL
jgi:hypothetical protein